MTHYHQLHELFNSLSRITYPYQKEKKTSGIYILFEKGEHYSGMDRITRIGSHTGENRLFDRLHQHFVLDHRQSIFRKHIGRCLLARDNKADYIPTWNLEIKSKVDKEKHYHKINWDMEKEYEQKVSEYMQQNFSFVIIPGLTDAALRSRLERGLIATLGQAEERTASDTWLGYLHNDKRIKESKLWNVQHIGDEPLTEEELSIIIKLLEAEGKVNVNPDVHA